MNKFVLAARGLLLAAAALLIAEPGGAAATPFASLALQKQDLASPSLLHKIAGRCGWDYACPPRPDYGRRVTHNHNHQRAQTQFNIQNYGNVQINYYAGRGYRPYPYPYAKSYGKHHHKHGYGHGYKRRHYGNGHHYGRRHRYSCYGGWCGCGPRCWYKKFKRGYCGHGCEYYSEKVKFEAERRVVKGFRPVRYKKDYFKSGHDHGDDYLDHHEKHSRYDRDDDFGNGYDDYKPDYKKRRRSPFCGGDC